MADGSIGTEPHATQPLPMKIRNPFNLAILGALALSAFSLGAADTPDSGLIGKRYLGADLTWEHFHASRYDDAQGAAAEVNLPVNSGLDAAFGYAFSHLTGPGLSGLDHRLSASLLAYNHDEYGKAFFAVALEQPMDRTRVQGILTENSQTLWALGAGLEASLDSDTAVTCRVDYSDTFKSGSRRPTWRYRVQLNHWFTPIASGVVSLSYNQNKGAPDSLLYTVGVRVLF